LEDSEDVAEEALEVDPLDELEKSPVLLQNNPSRQSLFDKLKEKIEAVNQNEEEEIVLEEGEYLFTESLVIDNEKIINFLTEEGKQAIFKRAKGFTDTFIKVMEDAKLILNGEENDSIVFDGEGKNAIGRDKKGRFIHTEGHLIINHATFQNDRYDDGTSIAPIKAVGEKAYVEFNDGVVKGTNYSSTYGGGNWYSSGGFYLDDGAKMVMNGGIISGNYVSWFDHPSYYDNKWTNYQSTGGITVNHGSSLTMNGGIIKDNFSSVGGILVGSDSIHDFDRDQSDPNKLENIPISELIMNGGTIDNNTGAHNIGAGGISIYGSGKAKMTGGIISNNKGYKGGGILASDQYAEGETEDKNFAKAPFEEWTKRYPAEFIMEGGVIKGNESYTTGGGININSNNVLLTGGKILDNVAFDQGGGIYVTTTPYTLRLKNAVITENSTYPYEGDVEYGDSMKLHAEAGGGIWFCPTGDAKVYIENGGAIFGNTAGKMGDDFHSEKKLPGHYTITLPTRMFNGGKILYYEDADGNRYDPKDPKLFDKIFYESGQISVKAIVEDEAGKSAKKLASLLIKGNISTRGGGIGSNGSIIMGDAPSKDKPLKEVEIKKEWEDGVERIPVEFKVGLLIDGVKYPFETIRLTEENDFTTILKDLPGKIDGFNLEDILYVEEITAGNFIFEASKPIKTGERVIVIPPSEGENDKPIEYKIVSYALTATNKKIETPTGDLVIS
ncbi:MAG: hypothetical protein Q4Q07_10760, partial [Tissierellia bacterium]|nr:hypothetical protein [Tissierellia bacterium]